MSSMLRQFRGLGIALTVLALSAGAVFAAAPSLQLTSSHGTTSASVDASESAEPSDSPEASKSAEPSETAEPSDSPSESAEPSESPSQNAALGASPSPDTHGALVSTAAQMPTPSGFPNHGAFVSCVAHLDASVTGFSWATVTPQSCGITPSAPAAKPNASQGHGHGNGHGNNGQGHGANGH